MTIEPLIRRARRSMNWQRPAPRQVYPAPLRLDDPDVVQLRAASMLLDSGVADRVTLVNLRCCDTVDDLREFVAEAGIDLEVLPGAEPGRVDARLRRIDRDALGE